MSQSQPASVERKLVVVGRLTRTQWWAWLQVLSLSGLKASHAARDAAVEWTKATLAAPSVPAASRRTVKRGSLARPHVVGAVLLPAEYDAFWRACQRSGLELSRGLQAALVAWTDQRIRQRA